MVTWNPPIRSFALAFCHPNREKTDQNDWPALLDDAGAGTMRPSFSRVWRGCRSRFASSSAPLPLDRRWFAGDRSQRRVEGHEEGGETTIPEPGRVARHSGDAGMD